MNTIQKLLLFTDGSVNIKTHVGFGACTWIEAGLNQANSPITTKRFDNTSSTRLELQTLLWAISLTPKANELVAYTDSQNTVGLSTRRSRLEQANYCSAVGRPLSNADLYKEFFIVYDQLAIRIVKISGHKAASQKSYLDRLFSKVDKAARLATKAETEKVNAR